MMKGSERRVRHDFNTSKIESGHNLFCIALENGEEYTLINTDTHTPNLVNYGAYRFNQVCNNKNFPFERLEESFIEKVTYQDISEINQPLPERLIEFLYTALISTKSQTYTTEHFQGKHYFKGNALSVDLRNKLMSYQEPLISRFRNKADYNAPHLVKKNGLLHWQVTANLDPCYYFPQEQYQEYFDAKLNIDR